MNKKQLKFAADTVASIADHLDMPEAPGSIFCLMSSQEAGNVHAITTDNSDEDLIDMFASALIADDALMEYAVRAVLRAQMNGANMGKAALKEPTNETLDLDDFIGPEDNTDSTDPRTDHYWASEPADRAEIFREFTADQQLDFWRVEDGLRQLCGKKKRCKLGALCELVQDVAQTDIEFVLRAAGCQLIKGDKVVDAARSVFRLDV